MDHHLKKQNSMDHLVMLTPREQQVETLQKCFIKNLWNSLCTTRNSRWTTWTTL